MWPDTHARTHKHTRAYMHRRAHIEAEAPLHKHRLARPHLKGKKKRKK